MLKPVKPAPTIAIDLEVTLQRRSGGVLVVAEPKLFVAKSVLTACTLLPRSAGRYQKPEPAVPSTGA